MLSKILAFLVLIVGFSTMVLSQNLPQTSPTVTQYIPRDTELWANFALEWYQKDGSFIFAETNIRHSTFPNYPTLFSTPLYRIQQKIGYERYLDKNWALGVSGRVVFEKNEQQLFSQIYLAHFSNISKQNIELNKYLSFERIDSNTPNYKTESRTTIGLGLAKNFAIHNKPCLRPSISYEVFMMHYWLLNSHELYNRRTFDRTRLRIELAYFLRRNLTLALYYIAQADYYVAEPEYDAMQRETKPLRNLDYFTPIFGLRVHWQIFNSKTPQNIRLRGLGY
jgi:hypothetical protein